MMMRRRQIIALATIIALTGCARETMRPTAAVISRADGGPATVERARPGRSSSPTVVIDGTVVSVAIAPTARQTQQIATILGFFDAFNAGRGDEALAFFTADAVFSDCDYREQRQIGSASQVTLADWLKQRIADSDRFVVEQIIITSQSSTALGVIYARRTSDTLRAMGQPDGITPQLATKVILSDDSTRISAFSNGCG